MFAFEINNFNSDAIKLEANEAKLTSLWARNCTTIQQVWIVKFAFGVKKILRLSRNRPSGPFYGWVRTLSNDFHLPLP